MQMALVINASDNVAVALQDLALGQVVRVRVDAEEREITLRAAVSFGHKFALTEIDGGDAVIKYGQPIGRATETIEAGDHVHTHNLASARGWLGA